MNEQKQFSSLDELCGGPFPAFAENSLNPDAVRMAPLPLPIEFASDMDSPVDFDGATSVLLDCPDEAGVSWLQEHFKEWFGEAAPRVVSAATELKLKDGVEAYAIRADLNGVRVAAHSLVGVRWAAYSLRQLAIAKRGTFKTAGRILPSLYISDEPKLAFRGIHLCWFPETRPEQIERAIRLAAFFKFNYVIIEPWGMYVSEKHPWWHWNNATMTKELIHRLVAIGRDLGVTLIPQINCFGHASSSRSVTVKHAVLDISPEYEPLYEPGGWNWCLSNPETQRVLRELIAEMHEDFGKPPYFHLGCDEAQPPTCPECRKVPYGKLVAEHITNLASFVKSLGAQSMIWHDMLLERGDSRWNGFVHYGTKATAELADTLPKDVIICDWEYSYGDMKEVREDWPTIAYFKEKGFPVVGCPWLNFNAMKPMADFVNRVGGFGLIETTWHHLRGNDWVNMYTYASSAAWGSELLPPPPMTNSPFANLLRFVGKDMKISDYRDTGHFNYQIPPSWWAND